MKTTTLRARVALQEIEAMGLTLDDLVAAAEGGARRTPATTVADYVEVVAESYRPRSRRTYNSYWRLTVELLGDLALDQVGVDDLIGSSTKRPAAPASAVPAATDEPAERAVWLPCAPCSAAPTRPVWSQRTGAVGRQAAPAPQSATSPEPS